MTTTKAPALPHGIVAADLKYPKHDAGDGLVRSSYERSTFDIWYTERMGWVIPTLRISNGNAYGERTYAVAIGKSAERARDDVERGAVVRVGAGPHVLAKHTVYIRQSRADALTPFIELRDAGAGDAGEVRDRISTRRAQSALIRSRRGW